MRPGDLSAGWTLVFVIGWVGVAVGFAAVWNASVQLGLSTWWLGPAADRRPLVIRLLPFVAPLLAVLAAAMRVRWLPWIGVAAAAATAAIGIGDLGRVTGLAIVELLLAACGLLVSLASTAGMYRRAR
jgi:hypothetical protein